METYEMTSWLTAPRLNRPPELTLFCLPYAGGGANIFRTWHSYLPPEIEVRSINLPGRDSRLRDAPITRMEVIIDQLGEVFLSHLKRPFAFFGHSMGAAIAFELTRYLRREQGVEPVHLFVSGHSAPQIKREQSPSYNLPDDELISLIRYLNGTHDGVLDNPELMQLMLPIIRADFAICDNYTYTEEPPLNCPITVFGGLEDKGMSRNHLDRWFEQTNAQFKLHMLPGDHFFIRTAYPSLLRLLSKELQRSLNLALRRTDF